MLYVWHSSFYVVPWLGHALQKGTRVRCEAGTIPKLGSRRSREATVTRTNDHTTRVCELQTLSNLHTVNQDDNVFALNIEAVQIAMSMATTIEMVERRVPNPTALSYDNIRAKILRLQKSSSYLRGHPGNHVGDPL